MLEELNEKIIAWSEEKGINNPKTQLIKSMEEFGELENGIEWYQNEFLSDDARKDAKEEVKDAIGDTYITIVIEAHILGVETDKYIYDMSLGGEIPDYFMKGVYELGRIAKNISHDRDIYNYRDAIMMFLGRLASIARLLGLDFEDCVYRAYKEIENRNGKTVDGNFIKEQ